MESVAGFGSRAQSSGFWVQSSGFEPGVAHGYRDDDKRSCAASVDHSTPNSGPTTLNPEPQQLRATYWPSMPGMSLRLLLHGNADLHQIRRLGGNAAFCDKQPTRSE